MEEGVDGGAITASLALALALVLALAFALRLFLAFPMAVRAGGRNDGSDRERWGR